MITKWSLRRTDPEALRRLARYLKLQDVDNTPHRLLAAHVYRVLRAKETETMEERQKKCRDLLDRLPGYQINLTFVPLNNGTPNKSGAMADVQPYVLARLKDHANTLDVTERADVGADGVVDVVDHVIICVVDKAEKLLAERSTKKIADLHVQLAKEEDKAKP